MPTPGEGESHDDFIDRCIPQVIDDGTAEDGSQAKAICESIWRRDMADNLHSLIGVEIFRAGKWNGDEFTTDDLDEMVANFDKVGFRPPVKLGHTNNPDDRAFGFVDGIRRKGDKLLADFSDVPGKVVDLIKEKAFDAVSSEIFFNLKRNGETFRRALAGVALLGAQVPAVSGLKPLSDALPFTDDDEIRTYDLGEDDMADDPKATRKDDPKDTKVDKDTKDDKDELKKQLAEAQEQIAALQQESDQAKQLREQADALKKRLDQVEEERLAERIEAKVRDFNIPALKPHLRFLYDLACRETDKRTFATTDDDGNDKTEDVEPETVVDRVVEHIQDRTAWLFREATRADGSTGKTVDDEVDEKVRARMKQDNVTYSDALTKVLNENEDLRRQYATQ